MNLKAFQPIAFVLLRVKVVAKVTEELLQYYCADDGTSGGQHDAPERSPGRGGSSDSESDLSDESDSADSSSERRRHKRDTNSIYVPQDLLIQVVQENRQKIEEVRTRFKTKRSFRDLDTFVVVEKNR